MADRTSRVNLVSFHRDLTLMTGDVLFIWFGLVLTELALLQDTSGALGSAVLSPEVSLLIVPILIGFALNLIQRWRFRDKLRSLVLRDEGVVQWKTVVRSGTILLADILQLKLYTTTLSPPGSVPLLATYSGAIHHRSGVIFADSLSGGEFEELRLLFNQISQLNPASPLIVENRPYSTDMEIASYGA